MNNRTEQYIWITFGNETKNEPINYCKKNSNVMMGLGYHINPKTRELESNYYCSSNSGNKAAIKWDALPIFVATRPSVIAETKAPT